VEEGKVERRDEEGWKEKSEKTHTAVPNAKKAKR